MIKHGNRAKNHGIKRMVAASSAACYGIPDPLNIPLQEIVANGGIAPYSQTKFKMEKLMQQYSEVHGLPTTALRFFNVYGPRQDPHSDYSGVISWFMDQAHINGNITVTGDGEQYRDFVYVKDVARAIRTAMELKTPDFDVYNVATGSKTTVNVLAQTIVDVFSSSAVISHIAERPGDVKESLANTAKTSQYLGFTSEYVLRKGLEETRDWFIETQ